MAARHNDGKTLARTRAEESAAGPQGDRRAVSGKVIPIDSREGDTRFTAILDAAEAVFAASGYEGATMREIAVRAGVAQGLIHYHFSNKQKLFESVIVRRAGHINTRRERMLADLFSSGKRVRTEQVVAALFRPTIESGLSMARDGGGFARILVMLANSTGEREQALAQKHYDPIALKFIDALQRSEPELSREDAVWAYMFAIGVGMTMMAKTGRSLRLSGGVCDDGDIERMMEKIVTYICGGIRALARKAD